MVGCGALYTKDACEVGLGVRHTPRTMIYPQCSQLTFQEAMNASEGSTHKYVAVFCKPRTLTRKYHYTNDNTIHYTDIREDSWGRWYTTVENGGYN